ncbi:protein FAM50 homolog [Frankliniella occidentalis]|uniref:Protein FAM50 homolog n=1 Tax=Frankliniella occidentalis TaxID=133901 RepID=A0A9C6TT10_FRAOC|nr:protein FAM50 homolog [Frankliniella occidentalis]
MGNNPPGEEDSPLKTKKEKKPAAPRVRNRANNTNNKGSKIGRPPGSKNQIYKGDLQDQKDLLEQQNAALKKKVQALLLKSKGIDSDCSLLDYCEKPKPNSNNQLLTEDSEKSSEDESEKEVEKDKTKNKTCDKEKNDGKSDSEPDTEEKNDGRATEQDNENEGSDQEEDDGEWKKTVAAVKTDLCASATAVDKRLKANPNDDQQLYLGYGLHVSKD